jgi:pyruvate/2-oxoglutarate dehydrogenase complex dihydrolipoamide dehydrogenase (E3) component
LALLKKPYNYIGSTFEKKGPSTQDFRFRKTFECPCVKEDKVASICRRNNNMKKYDLIWIGTGQATGSTIPRLNSAGKSIALIEGGRVGGSCVNYGCTPTKTLVASARAAHMARRGPDFGVETGDFSINFDKIRERMNTIRNNGSSGLEGWLRGMENVDFYAEYASFINEHTVQVGDEVIYGETIVIHTGTRSRTFPFEGLDSVDWIDNQGLLDLEELPKKLLIIGGSYIGMEFGQAYRRFGSEVTIIEGGPQLMGREDADIAQAAQTILEKDGIKIITGSFVKKLVQHASESIEVFYEQGGTMKSVQGSHLLIAVGRLPNSDKLNLEAAGVEANGQGYITVNDTMQTNVPHIFAVGDINGQGAFTHTSVNDGEIFYDFYTGSGDRKLSDRNLIYSMFIDPPLGRIGMNEKEARASDKNILMATRKMSRISRAREKDETDGLIKIFVDADTEEFLGVTILGIGGDEIINIFAPFMMAKASYKLFRRTVLTHPTVAELLPWILDDLKPLK